MARFNSTTKKSSVKAQKTVNRAGGEAFKESAELEITNLVLTSFVQDQFYRKASDTLTQVDELSKRVSPYFLAQLAVFARVEFGMRSISHVVAANIANNNAVKGSSWLKNFFNTVVYRPDDMSEILALYLSDGKKPIPNSLKKGFAKAFDKFDGYQLAKYRLEDKDVSLIDIVNLVHPKPIASNAKALKLLVNDELKSKGTWESELSKAGQIAEDEEEKKELKKDAWLSLLTENKIGYFALLRNLRNIIVQAPEAIPMLIKQLTNEKAIKNSLVLPFRFITAYEEVEKIGSTPDIRKVLVAIEKALDISCSNVPVFDGNTLVVLDVSGSMSMSSIYGRVNTWGGRTPAMIGALFAAILLKSNCCDFMTFDGNARYVDYNPTNGIITMARNIRCPGGATNFNAPFLEANKAYDRIIILSDMQGWVGYNSPVNAYKQYCSLFKCKPKIYSFDLQGYGTLEFPQKDVYCLAGFSDKIFDMMKLLEQDREVLLNKIKQVKI